MEYRPLTPNEYDRVRGLLSESGWRARVARTDRFIRMMENADRTVVAMEGNQVVGFARALRDDVSNGYISTVVVAADSRGQGIGSEMVKRLIGEDGDITWVLRAGKNSKGLWQKMGFEISEIAMERTRAAEKEAGQ
jgi:ribosomal protein S18 acetylase RimI-like enzyme